MISVCESSSLVPIEIPTVALPDATIATPWTRLVGKQSRLWLISMQSKEHGSAEHFGILAGCHSTECKTPFDTRSQERKCVPP